MKLLLTFFSVLILLNLAPAAHAQDSGPDGYQIDVQTDKGTVTVDVPKKPETMTTREYARFYYGSEFEALLIDASVAGGIQGFGGRVQAEVYLGLQVVNLFVGRFQPSYGFRVRVVPFKFKGGTKLFAELDRREYYYGFTDQWGHLTDIKLYNVGFETRDGLFFKIGSGTDVHHRWENETHGPEKGRTFQAGIGIRFDWKRRK
jgi:hypothetical protein